MSLELRHADHVDRSAGAEECWPWTGSTCKRGYGRISDWPRRPLLAHRVAYEAATKTMIPKGIVIRHTCNNPPCQNPQHLILGTQWDNVQDMIKAGRGNWGKKLTREDATTIRRRVEAGERQQAVAEDFGVGQSAVSNIVRGKTWI